MRVCIPVTHDLGPESPVSMHFGSAPFFAVAESTTGEVVTLVNRNEHHAHGQCRPLDAIAGQGVEAMVVGGIGMGAILRLQEAGVCVYRATGGTVREALAALEAGTLSPMDPSSACAGHHHG